MRDLRNHGGDIVDRVNRGEQVTITRAGEAVAELRPLSKPGLSVDVLVERRRRLPLLDPARLRADVDDLLDYSL
ncbi:MAG: type II toxin-antitoxin system prevent-host-death family antitoxin [Acidimicrobiia bacterium]|nr:type II toxin-antitoxin system prevent-host-death family antitoxin [Acidimicrobiia bacterium]